ncbi:NAD-dependent epimerase/dehydratase family protein [Actinomadura macrotermitis]|uniref:NAD-dependent epimerase/dehydratase domain-containing protein n=1 Tax=Actinomadura macrotermitis TaxID=2585200 RepID=A0A7K0C5D7_9ACTN|nr:NAD-dependent epimerase/dehydratase family protein [Actinomadura macrotermitis]MQY08044.1 hypothetical protein [Actinomadura macrotermitis]
MSFHIVVGAGATGIATALLLAGSGERVRLVTRGGSGPEHPLVERVALDAADAAALTEAARGAATVFNAAAPAYHTWPTTLPPLFRAVLSAAEHAGADYVMLGNLYGYGPVDGPLTEDLPLLATGPKGEVRARMWREAEAAHRAGRVRVTEVRAGAFLGTGAVSWFTLLVEPHVRAGRPALVQGRPDVPHGFTAVADVAAALLAVSRGDRAWGRAWHAPVTNATAQEAAAVLAEAAGAPAPRLAGMTDRELTLLGLTSPLWNELWEIAYMTDRPFVVDSSGIEDAFGLKPTPLEEVFAG